MDKQADYYRNNCGSDIRKKTKNKLDVLYYYNCSLVFWAKSSRPLDIRAAAYYTKVEDMLLLRRCSSLC